MGEWQSCKLGKAINLKRGYDLPKQNRMVGNVPIISSSGIAGYHNEVKAKGPGVITGRYGTIGTVFYSKTDFWPLNTSLYVQDFKGNDIIFVYYFLRNSDFEQFNDKSAVPGINRNHVHEALISIPPLPEQKAIASVLSSLDDKIDLLHRQNKTLEAIAETLFRQWFVEEVREDWEVGCLGDIASFHNGKKRPNDISGGNNPIYGGNGILGYSGTFNYEGTTIVIGRVGAYCGSLYIEHKPVWVSDNALVAKPIKNIYSSFLFFLLHYLNLNKMAEGSSHPLLTQTLLKSILIYLPPATLIDSFVSQVDVWLNKIDFNNTQIRTLEKLRDTLLPKLMSGEIVLNHDFKGLKD